MKDRAPSRSRRLVADPAHGPRLLVSVRSSQEMLAARAGGADILDVKEPSRGSLGMADVEVMSDIAQRAADAHLSMPLSVAVGELADWRERTDVPALPVGIRFAKLGLHGYRHQGDWRGEWLRLRSRIERRSRSPVEWVAVAYADAREAAAPDVDDILNAAIDTNCSGLLVDTFAKTGRTLLDWLDVDSLHDLAERCHAAGLFLALAGSLRHESLSALSGIPTDVIAIRSAACVGEHRNAAVCRAAVASFHDALRISFAHRVERSSPPLLLANR